MIISTWIPLFLGAINDPQFNISSSLGVKIDHLELVDFESLAMWDEWEGKDQACLVLLDIA
jgi:hypothetical protein